MSFCPTCNGRFDEGTFCPKDGTPLLAEGEQQTSLAGQVIGGRYRLTRLLGQGGMGEVYAAEHVHITKRVAVKVLHPEISNNPEALARFQLEAKSASSIGHDNIVAIDDFGQMEDGRFYLCMEFLDGVALSDAMQQPGGLPAPRAISVMIQVCDGLAAAHAKDIIHRDMKPENVFLTQRSDGSEVVKILDFGIAKVTGNENENLTKTGTVFGTPHYMSPEQALGQHVDVRADVYSVGVMLFEIFTGQVPFKAESFMGILSQHITKQPPVPSTVTPGRATPQPIETIILRAMAKEPDKRFATMNEMKAALSESANACGIVLPAGGAIAPLVGSARTVAAPVASMPTAMAPASMAPQPATPTPNPASTSQPVAATVMAPAGATPQPAAANAIPRTMIAGQAGAPAAAPTPTPAPTPVTAAATPVPMAPARKKKSNAGLIIGIISAVVVLGGGAAAAAIFWDDIMGQGGTTPPVAAVDSGQPAVASTTPADAGAAVTPADAAAATTETPTETPTKTPTKRRPPVKVAVVTPPTEKDDPPPTKKDDPPPTKKNDPPPTKKDDPPPTKKVDPPVEKAQPPRKSHYEFKLVTSPAGAAIIVKGRRIGRTPKTFKLRPGENMRVLVALNGYKDQFVTIEGGDEDTTRTIRLKRGTSPKALGIPGSDPF